MRPWVFRLTVAAGLGLAVAALATLARCGAQEAGVDAPTHARLWPHRRSVEWLAGEQTGRARPAATGYRGASLGRDGGLEGRGLCDSEVALEPADETPWLAPELLSIDDGVRSVEDLRAAAHAHRIALDPAWLDATERAVRANAPWTEPDDTTGIADPWNEDGEPLAETAIAEPDPDPSLVEDPWEGETSETEFVEPEAAALADPLDDVTSLHDEGRDDEALDGALAAFATNGDVPSAIALSWAAYNADDRWTDAHDALAHVIEHASGDDADALHYHLAWACARLDDAQCMEPQLAAMSSPQEVSAVRADYAFRHGELDTARAHYAAAGDALEHPQLMIAWIDTCSGRPEQAEQRLSAQLGNVDPESDSTEVMLALEAMAYAELHRGDTESAWLYAQASLAIDDRPLANLEGQRTAALIALSAGDLDRARVMVSAISDAAPRNDLISGYCFADPAEATALHALLREQAGDVEAAQRDWLAIARGGGALAPTARRALAELCPDGTT